MRSILKSTSTALSLLLRQCQLFNSQGAKVETKIEAFKLLKKHEMPFISHGLNHDYIVTARSCQTLAHLLKDNCNVWLDVHLGLMYKQMRIIKMDPTPEFETYIVPFSVEFLKQFTRENALVMYDMLYTLVELNLQDKRLWDALLQKLDTENCFRYIPLKEAGQLLQVILAHPEHNIALNSITRKLIGTVYQQRAYYNSFTQTRSLIGRVLKQIQNLKMDDLKLEEAKETPKIN